MKNLQVKFENLENTSELLKVKLHGRLSDMNAVDFKSDLISILKERQSDCIIDIKSLVALDVTGMNALAMAHRELELLGHRLTILSQTKSPIERAFSLSKFDRVLNLVRA